MRNLFYITVIFFWVIPSGFAQLKIHSFEEAEQLAIKDPKPFVVFTHTSWCKFCKMMKNSTFKNYEIIRNLNTDYYFILLDAESKEDIFFNNHTFKFKPTGLNTGIHELATALATVNNQVSYPTITILDAKKDILFQKQSYLKAKELIRILEKTQEIVIFEKNSFPNP